MTQDILDQVAEETQAGKVKISLQLDESTDVSNSAYSLVYCLYVHAGELKEEFLMCKSLKTTTKAVDIVEKMDNFVQRNNLTWNHVGSLCTDGASSMLVRFYNAGKKRAPHIISTHCVLHRHALASKILPEYLKIVLKKVTKCVNFIRARAFNHCLFKEFCNKMGPEHTVLLYHTEVRWLSRGHILSRVFELRVEIDIFLRESKFLLSKEFSNDKFFGALANLTYVFFILNQLNV